MKTKKKRPIKPKLNIKKPIGNSNQKQAWNLNAQIFFHYEKNYAQL
jgi:hypothetical protein